MIVACFLGPAVKFLVACLN